MAVSLCTLTWKSPVADTGYTYFRSSLTAGADTTIPVTDTIPQQSKVDTFTLRISKDSLEAPLKYEAKDSVVVLIVEKKILLFGKTRTDYKDITLTAPKVEVDQKTQIVTAYNLKDSTGAVIEPAHFKAADNAFTSDTIRYNFKTQVGLTRNTFTQDGEIYVQGETAKKVDANTTFIRKARFTTCNFDDPHFAFLTGKMKVINKKLAVSGPAHPEFEGVPIPVYLPFGYYPLSQGRHSGFLPPQFTTNEQMGLGLEGLGYYKVLSDYWDVKFYGNIYSYGGWSANVNPTYRKRYRYNGAFNLSMQTTKQNFKGDPDFIKNKSYFITWSHTVDSRARPGTTFSASVNAGSTKYNQYVPNSNQVNFQNQLGSSITYSKSWAGKPYNLTLAANHNQNNTTGLININLPDAGFSVSTIYPFQKKDFIGGQKWYQKLGIGYNGVFRNQVSFYDSIFNFRKLIDTLQWGAQHSLPISMSLPPLFGGALIVSPSVSYSQIWIAQKFRRVWDPTAKILDTVITKGLFTDHTASFSIGMNTAIFGTYQFRKSRIKAIRHVVRPSLTANFRPDLSKSHFYWTKVDTTDYEFRFSEFDGSMFGYYPEGRVAGLGFQLDNNLEMKLRSRSDTGENAEKRIRLIDGYGFSTGYNFLRDSMKLDHFNVYFRTNLFEKINLTANGVLNPYLTNERGVDIDKYAWSDGRFTPGRLTSASVALSTTFKSKPKDAEKAKKQETLEKQMIEDDPNLMADRQRLVDYMKKNPSEFVDFNIPWQISLSYSLYYRTSIKRDYSGFERDLNSNVSFDGSFNLTPKWNFSMNGYFDFDTKQFQTFQMSIAREMHCWQLSINVTPIGLYRWFSFSISPKASILQDLKINRTRSFSR